MTAHRYVSHPLPIRALNAAGPVLDAVRILPRLDRETLVKQAIKKTGLEDFGDPWFFEPLDVLIQSINQEANLSALGRFIMHKRLLDGLTTRLRAEDLFRQHPEIFDIPVEQVVVIAGLQRTGTTLLHRLFGSHPRVRAFKSWEVLNPVPFPKEEGEPTKRIKQARFAQRALRYIAPQFFAIHPVEYDMPEEDVLLLDLSFMSQSAEATMWAPTYARWLESQDHMAAYDYMKRMLQILLWQNPAETVVLKSPHHLEYLETIFDVFPEATVVQTHRDPQKTLPSFLSMVCRGAGVFSDTVDAPAFSNHWQRKIHRLIDRSLAVRAEVGEARFVDVSYSDLVDDPLEQMEHICARVGIGFNEGAKRRAETLLSRQTQNKYGRHTYGLADFGLTAAQVGQEFAAYRQRFHIPTETRES